MADQVEIHLPKTVINEGSQFIATARFRTRAAAAASIPTTAEYKIYNLSRREIIQDWTSLTPAAEIDITITASLNDLETNNKSHERFELLVAADRGLSTQVVQAEPYRVTNVRGYG